MRILKYGLETYKKTVINLPKDGQILDVQFSGLPVIWVQTENENDLMESTIDVFMTGEIMPDNYEGVYIGTIQCIVDGLVSHYFLR